MLGSPERVNGHKNGSKLQGNLKERQTESFGCEATGNNNTPLILNYRSATLKARFYADLYGSMYNRVIQDVQTDNWPALGIIVDFQNVFKA